MIELFFSIDNEFNRVAKVLSKTSSFVKIYDNFINTYL